MLKIILSILCVPSFLWAAKGPVIPFWTLRAQHMYQERHFIELGQYFLNLGRDGQLKFITDQERDLGGCRAIHQSSGGFSATLQCLRFLNREDVGHLDFAMFAEGQLRQDVDLLCAKLIHSSVDAEKMIESKALRGAYVGRWSRCTDTAWRQIFLTVNANFEADPVRTLTLYRHANQDLPSQSQWKAKTVAFFKKH